MTIIIVVIITYDLLARVNIPMSVVPVRSHFMPALCHCSMNGVPNCLLLCNPILYLPINTEVTS